MTMTNYMKGYYKYITGYDNSTKDFLEKIFTTMTNTFMAMPKKYLRLLCRLYQWLLELTKQNGGGGEFITVQISLSLMKKRRN